MKTLVLLPTYNEAENLPKFVPEVLRHLPAADLLIIDDNSPDGTGALADAMAQANPQIQVLHRPGKMGLGSAYLSGFRRALERGYEAVVQMDSDFSHDPAELPRLLKELGTADCVVGSRYVSGGGIRGWGAHRLWLSTLANLYARRVTRIPVRDLTGGFRCTRRQVLESVDLAAIRSEGYAFQIEFNAAVYRRGFRMREVPIVFADRTRGKSKLSLGVIWEAVFIVWRLRFSPGAKMV